MFKTLEEALDTLGASLLVTAKHSGSELALLVQRLGHATSQRLFSVPSGATFPSFRVGEGWKATDHRLGGAALKAAEEIPSLSVIPGEGAWLVFELRARPEGSLRHAGDRRNQPFERPSDWDVIAEALRYPRTEDHLPSFLPRAWDTAVRASALLAGATPEASEPVEPAPTPSGLTSVFGAGLPNPVNTPWHAAVARGEGTPALEAEFAGASLLIPWETPPGDGDPGVLAQFGEGPDACHPVFTSGDQVRTYFGSLGLDPDKVLWTAGFGGSLRATPSRPHVQVDPAGDRVHISLVREDLPQRWGALRWARHRGTAAVMDVLRSPGAWVMATLRGRQQVLIDANGRRILPVFSSLEAMQSIAPWADFRVMQTPDTFASVGERDLIWVDPDVPGEQLLLPASVLVGP